MTLADVVWANPVNVLVVHCECGHRMLRASNVSLVTCDMCGCSELWHDVQPKPVAGPWSEPVMKRAIH